VAQSTPRRINPREPEIFDYSAQHRRAAATTSTTRLVLQPQLPRQLGSANDNFDNLSRLETSRDRAANYSANSFARSTTSQNQLRLVGSINKLLTDQDRVETVQPSTLSASEEDFDHPPPLGEGEATACQGAMVSNNHSDPSTHVIQSLVRGLDWSGRFGQRKGKKPSRSLKLSPPQFIVTPGGLPFQEGRPLPPSDVEDDGQVVHRAKYFNQEVLMIHADEDCEGLERVQLDNCYDYLLDPLDDNVDETMDRESSSNIKVEVVDKIKKERCRLINAKRAQRRQYAVKTNQQGNRNIHDFSTGDLRAIINAGWDACNIIIDRQQEREEVEAYSTTRNHHPLEYLETTRKRKPEAVEQSTRWKKTPSSTK
jgi:hypothetical protein